MNNSGPMVRKGTGMSALAFGIFVIVSIAIISAIVYALVKYELINDLLYLILAIAAIAIIVIAGVYFLIAILAVPYYALKGEETQVGATYNLDDVKPVKETDSEKKE